MAAFVFCPTASNLRPCKPSPRAKGATRSPTHFLTHSRISANKRILLLPLTSHTWQGQFIMFIDSKEPTMLRVLSAAVTALYVLSAAPAWAHFIWVDAARSEQGKWQARAYFGETPEPGEARLIVKVAHAKSWFRDRT